MDADILTESEVADLLRVPASSLRQWRWLKTGPPYFKVGPKHVRYSRSDVMAWLAENKH